MPPIQASNITYICNDTSYYIKMIRTDSAAAKHSISGLIKSLSVRDLVVDQVIALVHTFRKLERQIINKLVKFGRSEMPAETLSLTFPAAPPIPAVEKILDPVILTGFMCDIVDFCNKINFGALNDALVRGKLAGFYIPPAAADLAKNGFGTAGMDAGNIGELSVDDAIKMCEKIVAPYEALLCSAASKLSEIMVFIAQLVLDIQPK